MWKVTYYQYDIHQEYIGKFHFFIEGEYETEVYDKISLMMSNRAQLYTLEKIEE